MRVRQPTFVTVFLLFFAIVTIGVAQGNLQFIRGQRHHLPSQLKPIEHYSSSNRMDFVVGLPLRNHEALTHLLHDIYNPASPNYRKYLTPSQFAERFAPDESDYESLMNFAKSHGFTITGTHANRTLLDVSGSAAEVEKAFHVRLQVYQHPSEARTFYAPDADPSVDLGVPILSIHGLDNFALPRPMDLTMPLDSTNAPGSASGSGPYGFFLGRDFRAAYAQGVSLNGKGQAIGLLELDGYLPFDIDEYEILAQLPNVTLTNVLLDGVSGIPGNNESEVALDIEMAISMAPGVSQVIVYEGTSPDDILNHMANDNQASQLSCSWNFVPPVDPIRDQIYEQFAAQGQTMFQSSGNSGAYASSPNSPSDDPNITVVGGTVLTTRGAGGPWQIETAWPGSGGGSSTDFPIPTWQQGLVTLANQGSTAFRNIPDVSAVAASSIWLVAFGGQQGPIGGTSAAAPLWAGFAALANQQAAAQGVPPIGFLNPTLYAIGRSANYATAFHDITIGNNTNDSSPTNFFATVGYDLCTGWGSPNGSNLINALVSQPDALQIFPSTNLIATGSAGKFGGAATQYFTLTNIGVSAVDWVVSNSAPWLDVSPTSGNLPSGGTGESIPLNLNAAASSLPAGNYTATVWFTNLTEGFAQSRQFILNVLATSSVPLIVIQPVSQTALPGASASFSVVAVGQSPLSYQWQKNTTNLIDGQNISGATNSTLTVNSISSGASGIYSVVVSNALETVASTGAVLTVTSVTAPGVTISNLYSFTGGADGSNPNGLMQDTNGYFYGTTQNGGLNPGGTIFQMPANGGLTTLAALDGSDSGGFFSTAALIQGLDGFLYGTTQDGGINGVGTIFKTSTNGILTTVYSFDGGDGAFPNAPLIVSTDGNMYGTTSSGGVLGDGEIFRLTPTGALTQIGTFDYTNGFSPNKLLEGTDGSFYGTAFGGGNNGDGVIFNLSNDGELTTPFAFAFFSGGYLPLAGLAQDAGGAFFGTTFEGGSFGAGTVFEMSPTGAVTTIYSFTGGNDGGHPSADLIQGGDGNFYGTTSQGGAYNAGTVFRLEPNGNIITLATFDGYNGANPQAPLVWGADENLYGATQNGGATGNGAIFRVNINYPSLQITSQPGGESVFFGEKAVFSVAVSGNAPLAYQWWKNQQKLTDGGNISGSTTRVLVVSNATPSDSAIYSVTVSNALGSVTSDGAFLGVILSPPRLATPVANQIATVGGSAIFHAAAVGNLPLFYQWQSNHINLVDGPNVSGATTSVLTLSGLTQQSDATISVIVSNTAGTTKGDASLQVFPASLSGTLVSSLYWFGGGDDGGTPNGLVLSTNGLLYGTTQSGGAHNAGTIFSLTTNGIFQTLVSFDTTNGSSPQSSLTQGIDGNLYGTTENGGTNSAGTLFMLTTNGALMTLFNFGGSNGINPYTALVQANDGSFYGSAQNASKPGDGLIFRWSLEGALEVVYSFSGGQDGNEPIGALTSGPDGNLYGMTTAGAADGYGGIFRMTLAGALTNLYSFTGGTNGYNPYGALALGTDGSFYGVTRRNTIQNIQFDGTIFKFSPEAGLTTLYTLNPLYHSDGEYPFAGLIQGADGNFYGTTLYSDSTENGTVFGVSTSGDYVTLTKLNGSDDGTQPKAALVQDAQGNLYGTTTAGGPYGKGSIFRISITSAPEITAEPSNEVVFAGGQAQFSVGVFGASPLTYQWLKNGGNLSDNARISGSASRVLTVKKVTDPDAGTFTVTVSDALGTITTSGATLTILSGAPVIQAVKQTGGTISFTWNAVFGVAYQVQTTTDLHSGEWVNVGSAIDTTNNTLSASYPLDSASQQFYRIVLMP